VLGTVNDVVATAALGPKFFMPFGVQLISPRALWLWARFGGALLQRAVMVA
jgi:hypothetical protein